MKLHSAWSWRGIALLCVAAVAGCGKEASAPALEQQILAAPGARPSFVRGDARLTVAHTGLRRIEFAGVAGPARSFRERITTDGKGRYAIEPVDTQVAAAEWQEFELFQRAREGFLFRYRDFLVRDLGLFASNWKTIDLGQTAVVAGRTCHRYRVERTVRTPVAFELSVDASTGLILASQELDDTGRLVVAMTYESFALDPDTSLVVWHEPINQERALDPQRSLAEQVHQEILRPRLLPAGQAPLEAATVGDGTGTRWLKLTYSDGVEPLFFFQMLDVKNKDPRDKAASTDPVPTYTENSRAVVPSSVTVFQIGSTTAVQGTVDGFQLIVIGKAARDELLDLIESSLP